MNHSCVVAVPAVAVDCYLHFQETVTAFEVAESWKHKVKDKLPSLVRKMMTSATAIEIVR